MSDTSSGVMLDSSMTTRDSQDSYAVERAEILAALRDPRFWFKVALIVGSVFWIYWPAINGLPLIDDGVYLFQNPLLVDPHRVWKAWFEPGSFLEYYPMEQTVQWLQFRFWGFYLPGYHLTNICFHALGTLMVWRVLAKFGLRLAWTGGLIFAVHPVTVESVAWMAELKNVLSFPFLLVAMGCYIEYENHHHRRDYWRALLAFVLSMLCKIGGAPLPFMILLYAWWRRGRIGRSDLKSVAPFLAVSIGLALVTYWCGSLFSDPDTDMPSLSARLVIAGGVLVAYFNLAVWPFGLLPIYPTWSIDPSQVWPLWPWFAIFLVAAVCWHYRTGWGRHAALGLGFFALSLAPFLGIAWISYMRFSWVMDHLLYVGLVGIIGLAVALLEIPSRRYPLLVTSAILAITVGLAFSARNYAADFSSQEKLYNFTIEHNPLAWTAYNNLAAVYMSQGHPENAIPLADRALELNSHYDEASYNKALALESLGRYPEALEQYRRTMQFDHQHVDVRMAYARALQKTGNLQEAANQYRAVAKQFPNSHYVQGRLGALLARLGQVVDAEHELNEAIRLAPTVASYHTDLGNVFFQTGRTTLALEEYRRAVQLDPDLVEAHNNLAGALQHTGHPAEAVEEFKKALKLDPRNTWLMVNMASALADAGRRGEAIEWVETALRLDPGYQPAVNELKALDRPKPAPVH